MKNYLTKMSFLLCLNIENGRAILIFTLSVCRPAGGNRLAFLFVFADHQRNNTYWALL